jgi:hypothetical protein
MFMPMWTILQVLQRKPQAVQGCKHFIVEMMENASSSAWKITWRGADAPLFASSYA